MEINLACMYATMINVYFVCTFGQGTAECTLPISLDFDLSLSPSKLKYESGDVITYSCKEGTRLRGTMRATCTDSGLYPSDVPECLDNLKCHTWEQTVCEPSGPDCNRLAPISVDKQRNVVTCGDNVRLCYVYQVSARGGGVTSFNSNLGGCVDDEQLVIPYGCYNGSSTETLDSPFKSKFSNQVTKEEQFCFCDRELCNESAETASRNDAAIISPLQMIMVFECMIWWT